MRRGFELFGRRMGHGESTLIVAEMSANHNRDFKEAVKIIRAAKKSGADAVKLQTYTPDTLTIKSDKKWFRITGGRGQTLYDLYSKASMPWEWQPKLKAMADDLGIGLFSTAFDPAAVEFLEKMGVVVHKVASSEIVDHFLIEKMARTGKPMIISTGMATLNEIREAATVARNAGASQLILLKCTSAYPAPPEEMNLKTIPEMKNTFGVPVGLSDHTLGITVPIAAVTLGVCVVEKHLTLSRAVRGPDSHFSLEPGEFATMVQAIRTAEEAMGEVRYGVTKQEARVHRYRRSLFVVKDMEKGEVFTEQNVRSIRPGQGLPPKCLKHVLGKRASMEIDRATPLVWDHISRQR